MLSEGDEEQPLPVCFVVDLGSSFDVMASDGVSIPPRILFRYLRDCLLEQTLVCELRRRGISAPLHSFGDQKYITAIMKETRPWQDNAQEAQQYRDASMARFQSDLDRLPAELPKNVMELPSQPSHR